MADSELNPKLTSKSGSPPKQLTAAELLKHPEFPHVVWNLKPDRKGRVKCGAPKRAYNIAYEIHGNGPRKVMLIMGLSEFMTSWMRQTKDFGHTQSDKYSVLILDNRGMGESDRPLFRYSTSSMARDCAEVLDAVGWKDDRSVHVCGISMGGMIALELGYIIPQRIASLMLVSTCSRIINNNSFSENMKQRINFFIPKSTDEHVRRQKAFCYTDEALTRPDEEEYTVQPFPTMGDRLGATEVNKRTVGGGRFTRAGLICQALACVSHNKSPEEVQEIAEKVGRSRICVVHGTADVTLAPEHGKVLMAELDAGVKDGEPQIRQSWWEGQGHVVPIERRKEFNALWEELIDAAVAMDATKEDEATKKEETAPTEVNEPLPLTAPATTAPTESNPATEAEQQPPKDPPSKTNEGDTTAPLPLTDAPKEEDLKESKDEEAKPTS